MGINEESPDSRNAFWCKIGISNCLVSSWLVCVIDEMGNAVALMNFYSLLEELDQEEIENCEVCLVQAGLGDEFNHTSKLHAIKYKEAINGLDGRD